MLKPLIIAGITIVIIAGIIGIVVSDGTYTIEEEAPEFQTSEIIPNNTDTPPELQEIQDLLEDEIKFDFETHDFVRFYEGSDGSGATIVDILNSRMYENYPDLDQIVFNPHRVEWYNYVDEDKGENYVIVGYAFETFKEDSEYIWEVEKSTNIIIAKNDAAQELLDIVNSEN